MRLIPLSNHMKRRWTVYIYESSTWISEGMHLIPLGLVDKRREKGSPAILTFNSKKANQTQKTMAIPNLAALCTTQLRVSSGGTIAS